MDEVEADPPVDTSLTPPFSRYVGTICKRAGTSRERKSGRIQSLGWDATRQTYENLAWQKRLRLHFPFLVRNLLEERHAKDLSAFRSGNAYSHGVIYCTSGRACARFRCYLGTGCRKADWAVWLRSKGKYGCRPERPSRAERSFRRRSGGRGQAGHPKRQKRL